MFCFFIHWLSTFLSLQWWNPTDSQWHQPRHHSRAKNQGQVRAGRILSCEYCVPALTPTVGRTTNRKSMSFFSDYKLILDVSIHCMYYQQCHSLSTQAHHLLLWTVCALCLVHISHRHLTRPQATYVLECQQTHKCFLSHCCLYICEWEKQRNLKVKKKTVN